MSQLPKVVYPSVRISEERPLHAERFARRLKLREIVLRVRSHSPRTKGLSHAACLLSTSPSLEAGELGRERALHLQVERLHFLHHRCEVPREPPRRLARAGAARSGAGRGSHTAARRIVTCARRDQRREGKTPYGEHRPTQDITTGWLR